MEKRFYFDTSIWLDFLENRDEPNFPKGERAKKLIDDIINSNHKIVMSEVVKNELITLRYSRYEIDELLLPLKKHLIEVYSDKKEFGKAKDWAKKRGVPLLDALHAVIARDNKAVLITRDEHFMKLRDIIKTIRPEDITEN